MRTKLEYEFLAAKQDVGNLFNLLLREDFGYEWNGEGHPRLVYQQLCRERERFIRHEQLFNTVWHKLVASNESFDSFSKRQTVPALNDTDMQNYQRLLHEPHTIDNHIVTEFMSYLCMVDASLTIELICKKHPDLMDLSQLLAFALASLNRATVKTLIDLGADIHKPLLYMNDSDNHVKIFCSPLFYALFLPENPQLLINRWQPMVKHDHPKLVSIVNNLLENGANPEQRCIYELYDACDDELQHLMQVNEEASNCKLVAKEMLNKCGDSCFSKDYLAILQKIVDWQSPVQLLGQGPTY